MLVAKELPSAAGDRRAGGRKGCHGDQLADQRAAHDVKHAACVSLVPLQLCKEGLLVRRGRSVS